MASAGSATAGLRHSFLAPSTTDPDVRATKMARTPSLPAHRTKPSASAKHRSKRASGLFESSSESGSESSSHEPSPTDPVRGKKETRRRETSVSTATAAAAPSTRSRHHSLGASPVMVAAMPSRENSVNSERKGLFEIDDDTADSVETLRERVKLRQKKKEHEVQSLKSELEAALARVSELDDALAHERREKDEFAIRMDECQRIIEKRNKQLIKASERLARITEQSESHVSELQQQLEAMKVEVERTKAAERAALERQRSEYEEKLAHERVRWEAQVESVTLAAAEKLRVKDAEEAHLQRHIAQLEADVVGATSRIAESSEYQILLKRCDDAEAISRGLRFQLEKAQNEKKYLKKQLAAATAATTAPASSNAFLPPTDLFADLSSTNTGRGNHSPTSSIASADLSSFDFSRAEISPPMSPIVASPPKPSLKTATVPEAQRCDDLSQGDASSKDGRFETLFGGGANDTGENSDDGPPPAMAPSQSESKTRPGSGTINFFEKISIKFKRTPSSPRNSTPAPTGGKSVGDETSSQSASPAPAMDLPPTNRRKVLSKRPKMYVAKSPSDYEESSDSIFGSDSDSDESSDEDDDDQPPPPPPKDFGSRSPTGSVEAPSVGATVPPPLPPPLFGDVSDNDGDSSSDDDDRPPSRSGDLRRVILPTPASPPSPAPKEPIQSQPGHLKTARAKVPSSSGDSDSDLSDSSGDEGKHQKAPSPAKSPTVRVNTSKTEAQAKAVALSSDSEQEVPVRKEETRRRRVSIDDTNVHEASANQPKTKRERSRSTEGDASAAAAAKVNRMNEYMEARARKRQEKLSKKEEKEIAEHKKREEYEKEWERMAEEERERRRKQQKARRTGKRRPSSMKTVRVSQMRNHMNKHQKDVQGDGGLGQTKAEDSDEDNGPPQPDAQRRGHQSSGSDASEDENGQQQPSTSEVSSPPLPPEPTAVNTDLYLRQQARLREHHEMEMKKKQDSAEADQVRGQIHRRVELWAFAKELHHMILTLDQISSNEALRQCQLMVVQSPDPETLRKAYRNIIRVIHPDKVRNATITEQLEAKELFTVLNQAFEKFKAQQQ